MTAFTGLAHQCDPEQTICMTVTAPSDQHCNDSTRNKQPADYSQYARIKKFQRRTADDHHRQCGTAIGQQGPFIGKYGAIDGKVIVQRQ
jgi:hypothetical protein